MTITASTDSISRRRNDPETEATTGSATPATPATPTARKADRVPLEIAYDRLPHAASPPLARAENARDLIAQARAEMGRPLAPSLCPTGAEAKAQLQKDAAALLPKLQKLEHDLGRLATAAGPYAKDFEEALHAAHEITVGLECVVEGAHLVAEHGTPLEAFGGGFAMGVGASTLVKGTAHYVHALEKLPADAKELVANAKPIIADVKRDLADVAAAAHTLTSHLVSGVAVSARCIGG